MTTRMNLAVLGLGGMGGTHVAAAKESPWVDRIIGYEPDPERAARRGRELEIEAVHDLETIWNDPSIRLVCIASINEVHAEQAIAALRAGKAVLCEKPMGMTLQDAQQMRDVAQETGGFLQIGFELRYSCLYETVRDWIRSGLIGRPLSSDCTYFCSEFHTKTTWRCRSTGTLVGEKLSHYLDLPLWWFEQPVDKVFALSAPNFVPYFNHPDNHRILYRLKDQSVHSLNFIMGVAETDRGDPLLDLLDKQADDGHALRYLVCGAGGAIEADVFRRRLRRWVFRDTPKKLESHIEETLTWPSTEDQQWFHNTHGQNLRVIERVAQGLPPEHDANSAYATMELVFAAEKPSA